MIRAIFHLILLLAVAAALTAWDARRQLAAPMPLEGEQALTVARGTAWSRLVADLQARGWLSPRTALYLKAYGRISGDAARIQAGEYALQPGTTPVELVALLKSGDVISYQLTLVEGWRTDQAWAAVRAHPKIKRSEGLDEPVALMQALGKADQHPEGRFLPETYRFTNQTSDVEFMRRAYVAMEAAMARQWAARQPDLPLASADDALILASIIERETADCRRVRAPPALGHAIADRSHRDLWHGRRLRRQHPPPRSAHRHALQHLYPQGAAAHPDCLARGSGAGRRSESRRW